MYALYVCMYASKHTFASFSEPDYKRLAELSDMRYVRCLPVRAVGIHTAYVTTYVCIQTVMNK